MNTQTKWLAALERRTKAKGFDLIVDTKWANTGTLSFQELNGFATYLSIPFDFQGDKLTLGWMGRNGEAVFPGRPNHSFASFKGETLEEAITSLLDFVAARFLNVGQTDWPLTEGEQLGEDYLARLRGQRSDA